MPKNNSVNVENNAPLFNLHSARSIPDPVGARKRTDSAARAKAGRALSGPK